MKKLTPKQAEILALVAQGLENKEIAKILKISVGTVKTHLNTIRQVFEVKNKNLAVLKARDLDLI